MSHVEEQVERLKEILDEDTQKMMGEIELGVHTRFTLADAIRDGVQVSDQAYDWTDEEGNMCAMSAAVVAAKARGYM